ncbi:DUF1972 domain-containing protein [Fulvivirga ulvae]|uniref:DUF1972 domain-containing protein n=1 Tax=Fulvivirga ulvae TaxID=2904245 RepID=UPI001F34E83A|nr:DUF1972 domain-containing protein [Fulvivirga ulvae]UII34295.1 DUF1972 domain-containing protein [Fulvivirga ulvae]
MNNLLKKTTTIKEVVNKVGKWTIVAFIIALPFSMLTTNLCLVILLVLGAVNYKSFNYKNWLFFAYALSFIWIVVGLFYSNNLDIGIKIIERRFSLIAIPFILFSGIFKASYLKEIKIAHVISCSIAMLICIGESIYQNYTEIITLSKAYTYLNPWYFSNELLVNPLNIHPTYLAMYCGLSLFFILSYLISSVNFGVKKILLIILSLLQFYFIIMLSSRTAIFAVSIGIIYIFIKQFNRYKFVIAALSFFIIASLIGLNIRYNKVNRIRVIEALDFSKSFSENRFGGRSLRINMWKALLDCMDFNPWLGMGTGEVQPYYNRAYERNNLQIAAELQYNAHNQYIEVFMYHGIIGLFFFLFVLFESTRKALICKDYVFTSFLILISLIFATESALHLHKGIMFITFFNIAFYLRNRSKTISIKSDLKKRIAVIGTAGIPAKYGGFETLAEWLVKSLNQKFDFTVYCSSFHYKQKPKYFHNTKLVYLPVNPNGKSSILYDSLCLIHCLNKSDVILILGVSGAFLIPIIRIFSSKKIIVNIDGLEWRRNKWGKLAKIYLKLQEQLAVKYSHKIVADNLGIQKYVSSKYGRKSNLITYGGSHAEGHSLTIKTCNKYGIKQKKYAFSVCRIEPENNIHIILEAFSKVTSYKLLIVGNWNSSSYGEALKEKYKNCDNILTIDPIYDQHDLNELRSNCCIYVHGHSAGGTNPSLVEAMWLGLPILAWNVNYNRFTTQNKALYFNSTDKLISLLQSLKTQAELDLIGKNLQLLAYQEYSWEKIARLYSELLK